MTFAAMLPSLLSSTLAILECHRPGRSGIPDSRHRPGATVLTALMARPGAAPEGANLATGVFACRMRPPMSEKFRHRAAPQVRARFSVSQDEQMAKVELSL
jgi:hypothetical protein